MVYIKYLYEIICGVLLSWISFVYLFFGRFFLAKLFFANLNCNGCGICVSNCSFGGIKIRGKKNPKPFWKYTCESCMKCSAVCPQNAIEAGQSWGIILYFIITIPFSVYILSYLYNLIPCILNVKGGWLGSIVNILFIYLALFISYRLFHILIQIPVINWIFTHTTMTHLKFWGRYQESETNLKEIK